MIRVQTVARAAWPVAMAGILAACGGGGSSSNSSGGGASTSGGDAPLIRALSPANIAAGGRAFTLTVNGANFSPSSIVLWNGAALPTTYTSPNALEAAVSAAQIAVPVATSITVSNGGAGGSVSNALSVTPLWAKPSSGTNGILVDAATQLDTTAGLSSFGAPFFAAWNPTSSDVDSPGMKITMFGLPNSACPAETQGPVGGVTDAQLTASGYPGDVASVNTALRFQAAPMSACTSAAAGLSGPTMAFFDGTQAWFATSSLGAPTNLLLPFSASGANGSGANAYQISTALNYRAYPSTVILPWAATGRARVAAMAQVTSIVAKDPAAGTQTKQLMGFTLVNTVCALSPPADSTCKMYWQFTQAIAQSNVSDWSAVTGFQHVTIFLDPRKSDMPTFGLPLLPPAGQTVTDGTYGMPLLIARGMPTAHAGVGLTQFDVEVDFSHLQNGIRIASALALGQAPGSDAACAQCVQVFGASWNDPNAWALDALNSSQEIYDPSGVSGAILGGYAWLYGGAAP